MSGYNGRHGPNVSKYVANLNTIPTHQDLLAEPLNIEEDLALFTNNDFIDWNEAEHLNASLDFLDNDQQQQPPSQQPVASHISAVDDPKMDYPMAGKCLACHSVSVSCSHLVVFASARTGWPRVGIALPLACARVWRTPPNSLHCTIAPHACRPFTAPAHNSVAASPARIALAVTQLQTSVHAGRRRGTVFAAHAIAREICTTPWPATPPCSLHHLIFSHQE
jgi:hypothetical protein